MDPQAPVNPPTFPKPFKPKDNHWITIAAMAVFVLLSLSAVIFLYYQNQQLKTMLAAYQNQTPAPTAIPTEIPPITASPSASPKSAAKACPLLAKQCPDGSVVSPTGPNCEFAPCPTP